VRETSFEGVDAVLCTVKSQHTAGVVDQLRGRGIEGMRIVCLQNGVENERTALRRFELVYGCAVKCPAVYLEPGIVQAYSAPVTGLLDVGRYPSGVDDFTEDIAGAFRSATFRSDARPDIVEVKYGKLLTNLGNAIEIVCGPEHRGGPLDDVLREEANTILTAAGIAFVPDDDPRSELIKPRSINGLARVGGSTLQSIRRGAGTIETDYLNGEIVLVGRLVGLPTPANGLVDRLAHEVAEGRRPPGSLAASDVLAMLNGG
jgi:2-dehydropantoate 2-reductase